MFIIEKFSQVSVALLKETMTPLNTTALLEQLQQEVDSLPEGAKGIVINFEAAGDITSFNLRDLSAVAKYLKVKKMQMMFLHLPRSGQKLIKECGLDNLFQCISSVDDIFKSEKFVPKVDVNFLNPFIEGALHTFKVQCNIEMTTEKMHLKGKNKTLDIGIAGVIGLTSSSFNGSIAICFPKETFLKVMEGMLFEKYEEITPDLEDGAGELLNIIFGHAKRILNGKNYQIDKAIPTIVKGKALEVRHLTPQATLVLPFKSDVGPLHIEVCIQDKMN